MMGIIFSFIAFACCFLFGWYMGDIIFDSYHNRVAKRWKAIAAWISGMGVFVSAALMSSQSIPARSFDANHYDVQYTLHTTEINDHIDSTKTFKIVKID